MAEKVRTRERERKKTIRQNIVGDLSNRFTHLWPSELCKNTHTTNTQLSHFKYVQIKLFLAQNAILLTASNHLFGRHEHVFIPAKKVLGIR